MSVLIRETSDFILSGIIGRLDSAAVIAAYW
jgi:hypothetical protein